MALAQRDLADFFRALNTGGSPVAVREALLEFFPELLAMYGDVAALLGADWYDQLRNVPPSAAKFRAVMASSVNMQQALATVRWAVGPLFAEDPDPAAALKTLEGATQRLVLAPSRSTVFRSATRDPVRTGVARVPSGPTTCRFCVMLASRGAVYISKSAALSADGNGKQLPGWKFHDYCDCVAVVVRSSGDYPEGHDLETYKAAYKAGSGIGRDIPAEK